MKANQPHTLPSSIPNPYTTNGPAQITSAAPAMGNLSSPPLNAAQHGYESLLRPITMGELTRVFEILCNEVSHKTLKTFRLEGQLQSLIQENQRLYAENKAVKKENGALTGELKELGVHLADTVRKNQMLKADHKRLRDANDVSNQDTSASSSSKRQKQGQV